jgi:hypothetical protein
LIAIDYLSECFLFDVGLSGVMFSLVRAHGPRAMANSKSIWTQN